MLEHKPSAQFTDTHTHMRSHDDHTHLQVLLSLRKWIELSLHEKEHFAEHAFVNQN